MRPMGRARGLIEVWEQVQMEQRIRLRRGGIWIPMIRVSGWGRVATLALFHELATQTPGPRQQTRRGMGRGLNDHNWDEDYLTSGMGRARVRNPSPHPLPDPPLHLPYTWPSVCVGVTCLPHPVLPCSESETDSTSGPPSLESINDPEPPESGYEASGSTSNSD